MPPHRVLAINRGERAQAIRVKIEADVDAMLREAEQFLILPKHPHAEFLRAACAMRSRGWSFPAWSAKSAAS